MDQACCHCQYYSDAREDSYGVYRYVRGQRKYILCFDVRIDPRFTDCRARTYSRGGGDLDGVRWENPEGGKWRTHF